MDRFADNIKCKLPKFNSKYWCPNTYQVDAFSVSWEGEVNWLVPPIAIIAQDIMHVRSSKAIATLVAPAWPSSPFWPLLFSRLSPYNSMIVNQKRFSDTTGIFVQGRNKNLIFGTDKFHGEVIYVKLDGSK